MARRVLLRDGAQARLRDNVSTARKTWFVNVAERDLRLASKTIPAVDAVELIPGAERDFERKARGPGPKVDAGAFEYGGERE